MCMCEIETVRGNTKCMDMFKGLLLKALWLLHGLCERVQHVYFDLHAHAFWPACICFCSPACARKRSVCVCVWRVCLCRQASSRAPLGDGLIQQGSTSKRQNAASASASLTLTWLMSHTERKRERQREREREREIEKGRKQNKKMHGGASSVEFCVV